MTVVSCRWDWCRSSFATLDALDAHVKHEHIWPMKPMRKTEIALMRKMDWQSLHSSLNTQSSVSSRGPITSAIPVPPAQTDQCPEDDRFETFTQLSSPPRAHSSPTLPTSPAFEGLVNQDGDSVSAAVEMFERTHGDSTDQLIRSRPSSGFSQEIVERHLTQEGGMGPKEDEVVDTELKWPTDDDSSIFASEENQVSEHPPDSGGLPGSTRGQNFRCASLNVPLGGPRASSQAVHDSETSQSQSQSFVLQTQAPYSSQALDWSQSQ